MVIGAAFLFTTFAVPSSDGSGNGDVSVQDGEASEDKGAVSRDDLLNYSVPEILVNLKGTSKKRILKIKLNVMYETDQSKGAADPFARREVELKDALTTLLTEKTMEDLESREDLNRLRFELIDELNKVVFPDNMGGISEIYYEQFLVQ